MKILAVEDDAVSRAVLRQALRKLGHECVEAADGEEGWAKIQQEPFRIVVSDWVMPKADGLELLVTAPRLVVADGQKAEVVTGDEVRSFRFSITPRRWSRL